MKSLAVVRDVPPDFFTDIAKIKGPHIPLYTNALVTHNIQLPLALLQVWQSASVHPL